MSREDNGNDGDRADEGNGDAPVDDLADEQVNAAEEQSSSAHFADAAGHRADEHVAEAEVLGHSLGTGLEDAQRGCHRGCVNGLAQDRGNCPSGHDDRPRCHEESSCRKCGVEEVLADAAVKLLYDDHCEECADNGHPPRCSDRNDQSDEDTGDTGGKVAYGARLLHELAVAPLPEHCRGDGDRNEQQCFHTEHYDTDDHCGNKCNDDIEHDAGCVGIRPYLRLVGGVKGIFFCFHLFSASFAAASARAFSSAAFFANRSFAVLKE